MNGGWSRRPLVANTTNSERRRGTRWSGYHCHFLTARCEWIRRVGERCDILLDTHDRLWSGRHHTTVDLLWRPHYRMNVGLRRPHSWRHHHTHVAHTSVSHHWCLCWHTTSVHVWLGMMGHHGCGGHAGMVRWRCHGWYHAHSAGMGRIGRLLNHALGSWVASTVRLSRGRGLSQDLLLLLQRHTRGRSSRIGHARSVNSWRRTENTPQKPESQTTHNTIHQENFRLYILTFIKFYFHL